MTGVGLVTPLSSGVEETWQKLLAGKSGLNKISNFDVSDLSSKIAAQVPRGTNPGDFKAEDYVSVKESRKMSDFILFGLAAVNQAVEDSGWKPLSDLQKERTGVLIGSGIGGLPEIVEASNVLREKGPRRLSPFFIISAY